MIVPNTFPKKIMTKIVTKNNLEFKRNVEGLNLTIDSRHSKNSPLESLIESQFQSDKKKVTNVISRKYGKVPKTHVSN